MDRTASAGAEQGEDTPAELPFRRPSAREPEAGGDKPLTWFGDPKPSDSGSISSPSLSSPAVSSSHTSGEAAPASPEFGPASPAGPGRVSFGFSDGPIGGARAGRARGADEPDSPPQRNRAGSGPTDTGELPRRNRADGGAADTGEFSRRNRAEGGPTDTGELPRRNRAEGGPTDTGELPRRNRADGGAADTGEFSRRRGGASDDLPIVRKAGNGVGEPAASDPFSAGWPESADPGPSVSGGGPLAGLATPLWPDSGDSASPRVAGTDWERRDEPIVWADTLPGPAAPTSPAAPGGTAAPAVRPRPRQSRLVTVGMAMLGLVALAAVALTGVVFYSGGDNQISDLLGGSGGKDQRIVTGPMEDRTLAAFELLAATDRVQLRIADLGDELYRISSPEGAGVRPIADLTDDRLRVDVIRDNAGTGGEIEVLLAAKVRWTIRFSGYSAERIVDLSAGRVRGIELVGGTRRAEMTLAQAAGTVPMKITGGIEELTLRAPTGSPVRVKVGGGAGTVTAGSRTLRDVAPGSTLTPKDWTTGNRYDIDAVAPVTLLTVETA